FASSPADVHDAAKRASAAARSGPISPLSFPSAGGLPTVRDRYDARVAGIGLPELSRLAKDLLAAARAETPGIDVVGGGVGAGSAEIAIANTMGVAYETRESGISAGVYCVLPGDPPSTGFDHERSNVGSVDAAAIGKKAARLARAGKDPAPVPDGLDTVAFLPHAAAPLVESLLVRSLYGERLRRKESMYSGKQGTRIAARGFDLVEDARARNGPASGPFDDEGVPARKVPLVADGVFRGALHDLHSASRVKDEPTGSSLRAGRFESGRSFQEPPRVTGRSLSLSAPRLARRAPLADIDHGVVVHSVMGAHTANASSGDFSVQTTTLFEVEDGEVVRPLKPAMLGGNLPKMLTEPVALGRDARWELGDFSPCGIRLPTIVFRGVRVTG
ncbi:MAG: TldD/PmbA family protein, partial [Methanobacteriota archaeon]